MKIIKFHLWLVVGLFLYLIQPVYAQEPLAGTIKSEATLYADPSSTSETVATLPSGTSVTILQVVDGDALLSIAATSNTTWYQVDADGSSGYVWSGFVTLDSVDTLLQAGSEALGAGDTDTALARYRELLDLATSLQNGALQGDILARVAQVYTLLGNYDAALAELENSQAIWDELAFRGRAAGNHLSIGAVYEARGDYDYARSEYDTARYEFQSLNSSAGELDATLHVIQVAILQGDYVSARSLLDEGIVNDMADSVQRRIDTLETDYLFSLGNYGEALEGYSALRDNAESPEEDIRLALQIANVQVRQGDFAIAQEGYGAAIAQAQEAGEWLLQAEALRALGDLYRTQGRLTLAINSYQAATEALPETLVAPIRAELLRSIGSAFLTQGSPDIAIRFFEQASTSMPGSLSVLVATEIDLGSAYAQKDEDSTALEYLHEAYETGALIGDYDEMSNARLQLGEMYMERGHYREAIAYFSSWLDERQYENERVAQNSVLVRRGLAYELSGDREAAIADYAAAIGVSEDILQATGVSEAVASLLNSANSRVPYQRLAVLYADSGDLEQALQYAERGRSILARNEITNGVASWEATTTDQTIIQQERELRDALVAAQALYDAMVSRGDTYSDDYQQAQRALQNARDAYARHLETMQLSGGILTRQLGFEVATLRQIQAAIPEDTTLVLYSTDHKANQIDLNLDLTGIAFVITNSDITAVPLAISLEDVEDKIRIFAADRVANAAVLSDLYEQVFAPIAPHITTTHLLISPDGSLNYIPFAALQPTPESYLIDQYTIGYISSGTLLSLLHNQPAFSPSGNGLLLAQTDAPGLPTLVNAVAEVEQAGTLLEVEPITDATEADLRANVSGQRLIWISAHAELDPFAPMFSAIHLAPTADYDGRIEVREIYELDITRGTDLVVLSGCETGTGGTGEDFGVLNRAFISQGADRVMASLWKVDDAATTELLTNFAQAREDGGTSAEALRAAMLVTRETYSDPYYWASFVLNGLP
jgi:CHAT domain-containing protein